MSVGLKNLYIATRSTLDRRTLLRGGGASIALPSLGAMFPAFGNAVVLVTCLALVWEIHVDVVADILHERIEF